ncbi:hypothetical protein ACFYXS_39410 [Streptomyces sp. NPDC002574]|uniref:hypothetical protein n=1 Tax=Streptomyces sp. NPDC002574 TaxID=3364652 RepID=UPI0036B65ACC
MAEGEGTGEIPQEPVAPTRVYTQAFKPLTDYYNTWAVDLGKRLTQAATVSLPQMKIEVPAPRSLQAAETLGRQLTDGLTTRIREAFEPITTQYTDQWKRLFASIGDLRDRIYPENLREAQPSLEVLQLLLVDEGIPLMWVPGPQVVRALLDAPTPALRRRVISQRWKGITHDCATVLNGLDHPDLQDPRGFALDVTRALREGHITAAQALAANLLDSLTHRYFDTPARLKITKNELKTKGIKFDLNDHTIRFAFTLAPVWCAYARYFPKDGEPIPRAFGRHPSAHGVSRAQYSRVNAIYALMLVTSLLKFFDLELKR